MADPDIRDKWQRAFKKGETHCEKLGAVHLLSHGIWAFKAHGEKGRTDLVMNEPITDTSMIEKTSTALVLTEWKKYNGNDNKRENESLQDTILSAQVQARNYSSGVLGGVELVGYRYIVVVSEKSLPAEFFGDKPGSPDDGVIYRHINIPVNPATPSVEAKLSR